MADGKLTIEQVIAFAVGWLDEYDGSKPEDEWERICREAVQDVRADQIKKDVKAVLELPTESTGVMRRPVIEPSAAVRAIRAQLTQQEDGT